jgi:ParB-like nuclease domain
LSGVEPGAVTDTTPTPSRARDNAAVVPAGILEHLDPNAVLIANVRDDANLDAQFIASVREHTVLQPITAIRTEDGLYVRDGQRRVLAAREVGLPTIPVYLQLRHRPVVIGTRPAAFPSDRSFPRAAAALAILADFCLELPSLRNSS